MLRSLSAAAGAVALGCALGTPVAAAAYGTTGPQNNLPPCHGEQHVGSGNHAFDSSHGNCVNFVGHDDSAYFHDSNNNLDELIGNHDLIRAYNSNNNFITINGSNDTLQGFNSSFNTAVIDGSNDFITAMNVMNVDVTLDSSVNNDFLLFTSGCDGLAATLSQAAVNAAIAGGHGNNTASSPVVIC